MADNPLRVYGFSIQVQNQDGVTKVKQFRRAVSNVDDTVEMLNSTLGDNVKVTAQVTQSEKEAVAQARMLTTQYEKQRRKTRQVVEQYTRLNQTIEQYGNDAETVNAITRLGSNATEEQKREVAELVAEYQRLRNAGDANRTSFRNLRGVTQNLSWQLQDVVVQAQMGTNWFTIISQQGSQAAASFGAWGAAVGAAVAIVGAGIPVLINYFDDTTSSTQDLEEATKSLNEVLDTSGYTVTGVADRLYELYKVDSQLARLKMVGALRSAQSALQDYNEEIKETVGDTLSEVRRMQATLNSSFDVDSLLPQNRFAYQNYLERTEEQLNSQAESLGVNRDQLNQLASAYDSFISSGDVSELTQQFFELSKNTSNLTPEFSKLVSRYAELAAKSELTKSQMKELNAVLSGGKSITESHGGAVESLTERYQRLRRQLTMTDRQIAIDNFLRLEAANLSKEESETTLVALKAYLDEKDAIESRNNAIKEARELDEDRIKQREELLKPIQSGIDTSLDAGPVETENEKFKKNMDTLRNLVRDTKQYEYSERARLNRLIEEEETRHQEALLKAKVQQASNAMTAINGMANMMQTTVDLVVDGTEQVKNATAEMSDSQKAMFLIMQTVSAATAIVNGISMGMKLADSAALYDWTGISSMSWIATGAAIGAAQAGAIMGTTIAGAFDEGGNIPANQMGIVSEYGDELVNGVLVKGPARVTSREDTAKMMNGGGGGMTINQTLNISGSGDQALASATKRAAREGAQMAYNQISTELKNGRGVTNLIKQRV